MTLALPRVVQRPSPNYSPTAIRPRLVVVHLMEGGYAGSIEWLCMPSVKASAHLCMNADGSEFTQLVPLQFKAWAQCAYNSAAISIEAPGFTAKGVAEPTLRGLAWATAWLLVAYGLPCRWAAGGAGEGFCSHHDLGVAGGGHVDICPVGDQTWMRFEGLVSQQYAALKAGPLPVWALYGLPAPHQVASSEGSASPEVSHGGADRSEPGDDHAHPTPSGYPHGSTADLQWRLNKANVKPLLRVDGWWGPQTIAALKAFQAAHGLVIDGKIGPRTWQALDKATAQP